MKLLLTLAAVIYVGVIVWLVGDESPTLEALPELERPAPAFIDPPVVTELPVGGRDAVAELSDKADEVVEEPATWAPLQDSPVALLSEDHWSSYAPTFENMAKQIRKVPIYAELTDVQLRQAWETQGFQDAWKASREHLALRVYTVGYQQREYDRWFAGESSVALETELQPVVSFITALPNPDAAWAAIDAYSMSAIDAIYDAGEDHPRQGDVEAKWALFGVLNEQSKSETDVVDKTLGEL